jgi:hypothetical protein
MLLAELPKEVTGRIDSILLGFTTTYSILFLKKKFLTFKGNILIIDSKGSRNTLLFLEVKP